jgi:hypothetical protein
MPASSVADGSTACMQTGYREGLDQGKELTLQHGFNAGTKLQQLLHMLMRERVLKLQGICCCCCRCRWGMGAATQCIAAVDLLLRLSISGPK